MQNELSIKDVMSDPLIAQLRKADKVSTPEFERILVAAAQSYRETKVARLHTRRADVFYRTIGAGELQFQYLQDVCHAANANSDIRGGLCNSL